MDEIMSGQYWFRYSFVVVLALTIGAALVFTAWPQMDIAVSRIFFGHEEFYGQAVSLRIARKFLHFLPAMVMVAMVLGWTLRRLFGVTPPVPWLSALLPGGRQLCFALATFALIPGLFANAVLKDNSGRPRPEQVVEFKGAKQFRPWWRMDGACEKNCSFVSGETSGAFWLVVPAGFTPPPYRIVALSAALAVGTLTAAGRVAFGRHFLSDVVFAALFTLLLCQIFYWLIFVWPFDKKRQDLRQ